MKKIDVNSYEYSNFSQNGEDGIIQFLTSKLKDNNKFFVEIGSGNGLENNSTNLVLNNWQGLVLDGISNSKQYNNLLKIISTEKKIINIGTYLNLSNINNLIKILIDKDISFFSLDIDSIDFYIMNEILKNGILPKILCLEYNSFLGKETVTVEYHKIFNSKLLDKKRGLYFGVSLNAWKELLNKYNYDFICVEKKGVNSFFVLNGCLDLNVKNLYGEKFIHNKFWEKKYGLDGKILERELLENFNEKLVNIKEFLNFK